MTNIVQLSDCHIFSDPEKSAYLGIKPYYTFEKCVHKAAQEDAVAYVFTGDISGDYSAASYQHFWQVVSRSLPVDKIKILPGNHDDKRVMAEVLPSSTLVANSVVSLHNSDLIFLDAEYTGAKAQVNLKDVEALLASSLSGNPQILFMHHHPVQSNSWMDKHELCNRDDLMALLATYGDKIFLFHGHIHHASQCQIQNITVASCPSTCWQW